MTVIQNLGIVRHGRRAGSARKSPELEVSGRNLVMPQEELERIRKNLTKEADEAAIREAKLKAKAELHAKSREQVSKWTNTLAGQRLAKLKAAEEREAREEAERVAIDLEEELYQQAQRKKIIEKAKKLQFEEADRTKEFHSALLFSEVLKERQFQMKHKKAKLEKERGLEDDYQAKCRAENEQAMEYERQRQAERIRQNYLNRDALLQQKIEKQNLKLQEEMAWKEEGRLQAQLAKEHEENKVKLAEMEIEKRKFFAATLQEQIKMIKQIEQMDKDFDDKENQKRAQFNAAKKKMIQMRKDKEQELFKEQQQMRGRMADRLAKEYREIEDNTEELLRKAQEEKDLIEKEKEKSKKEKIRRDIETIERHRVDQLKIKELANKRRAEMSLEELARMKAADETFRKNQELKAENQRKALAEVTKDNIEMINKLAAEERLQRDLEAKFDLNQLSQLKLEEDEFQEYAEKVIKKAEQKERNVFPLKVVKARGAGGGRGPINQLGIRPSYLASDLQGGQMPAYRNEATNEIRSNIEAGPVSESKKRLGFTY